jgi:hypothetical protein
MPQLACSFLQYGTHYAGYVRNLNAGLTNATAAGVKLASTDLTSEQQPQQQYNLLAQHVSGMDELHISSSMTY